MSESVSTVEAPARGLPPDGRRARLLPEVRRRHHLPRPDARAARRLGRLSDDPHDHPELLRPRRRRVHRARQLRDALHRRHAPHGDQEQLPLAPHRAGVRHGDRSRVRGPPRADPLLGRLQGRRLHADGDLALRRGSHLAPDVREGPVPGNGQRRDRGREGRGVAFRRPLRGAAVHRRAAGAAERKPRAREAARAR